MWKEKVRCSDFLVFFSDKCTETVLILENVWVSEHLILTYKLSIKIHFRDGHSLPFSYLFCYQFNTDNAISCETDHELLNKIHVYAAKLRHTISLNCDINFWIPEDYLCLFNFSRSRIFTIKKAFCKLLSALIFNFLDMPAYDKIFESFLPCQCYIITYMFS